MKMCTNCLSAKKPDSFQGGRNCCKECMKVKAKKRQRKRRADGPIASEVRYYKSRTKEQREQERAIAAERAGRAYKPMSARRKESDRKRYESQAKSDWATWIKVNAPDWWLDCYYSSKPWTDRRLSAAQKYRIRYKEDAEFAIKERIRRQVTKSLKCDGVANNIRLSIKNNRESNAVHRALGYTVSELKEHLGRQFTKGMDWNVFNSGAIHIDHVVPKSSFDLSDDDEWRRCWSMPNLRPCWARDNLRKHGKILFIL